MNDILLYSSLFKNKKVNLMKKFIQHGKTCTYKHVLDVTKLSLKINKVLNLNSNIKTLIFGAMLHDFYLYDWHTEKLDKLHGFIHSKIAMENAIKEFNINKNIQNVILSHMWPLNITKIPKNREAWIVCVADKICSIKETIFRK